MLCRIYKKKLETKHLINSLSLYTEQKRKFAPDVLLPICENTYKPLTCIGLLEKMVILL